MNRIFYTAVIITPGNMGLEIFRVGYGTSLGPHDTNPAAYVYVPEKITSLNVAIARGMGFLRQFQKNGRDARLEVLGLVTDDWDMDPERFPDAAFYDPEATQAPKNPIRKLTYGMLGEVFEAMEQVYALIDTPERGLTTRIALSNRSAITGTLGNLGGDFLEDTNDKSALLLE